jgi:hypothetical protein
MVRIDIECQCKLAIALKTCAFFIALQDSLVVAIARLRCVAFRLLLDPLTFARNDDLVLAWLLFLAGLREVARRHIRVSTGTQLFAAGLLAGLFALTTTVTLLLAFVDTTLQSTTTDLPTADLAEPARLILDDILATQTRLGCQERTLGAVLFVSMAGMAHLWMATALWSLAGETTRRRLSTTRERGL